MSNKQSRFSVPNPYWYEDLAERSAPLDDDTPLGLDDDLNEINESYLEVSRASTVMRGGFLLLGLVLAVLLCWQVPLLVEMSSRRGSVPLLTFLSWTLLALVLFYCLFMIWLDCHMPRDLPVRFNRQTKKVVIYDYNLSLNPFVRRRALVKAFDWNTVQAELTKQSGYNGKAYVIRYALVLVICRIGTNEVAERVTLKGNNVITVDLVAMWAYIKRYMNDGPSSLPIERLRQQSISFRRSLFTYMPYFDPSAEGADYRGRMGATDVVLAFLMMWLFWLWLPMGLCHYIAMKCAPEPQWPAELSS